MPGPSAPMRITLTRPDDWHLHLRDGEALAAVLPHTARQFARAIVMPNLKPPVTTVDAGRRLPRPHRRRTAGRRRFRAADDALPDRQHAAGRGRQGRRLGFVKAVKLYPAGATTNSDAGLTDVAKAYDTLAEMERIGLPLLVHGEVTDPRSTCSTAKRSSSTPSCCR
jgi:dihydroorotase